jgi:hypothetical protein
MALYAADIHVLSVIEVSQVREVVDAYPLNGGVGLVCLNNLGDLGLAGEGPLLDLVMAVHTDVGRGDIGILARHHTRVAVIAINLILPGVNLV